MKNKPFILIKLSGAALSSNDDLYSSKKIVNIAEQLKKLQKKYAIGLVVGGGNIYRGNLAHKLDINKNDADYMGILSTLINCIAIENVFNNQGLKAKTFSNIHIDAIRPYFNYIDATEALDNDYICLFAAGTGNPFFSTDTGAALKAIQLKADLILMGKDDTDGVYDSDPKLNASAKRYEKITYDDVLNKQLKVMDLTAITLCKEHKIKILVFNINHPDALIKALENKILTTIVE